MGKFFTSTYWFAQNPGPLEATSQKIFLGMLVFLFIGIFVFSILKNKKNTLYFKVWKNLISFCITNLFIGLLMLFFTEQAIPVLSSRFWFLFWAIGVAFWSYIIISHFMKIPEIKLKREKQREFTKYLP